MSHNSVSLSKVASHWSKNEPIEDEGKFYMSPITRSYIIETAYGKDLVDEYKEDRYYAENIFINKYLKDKQVESMLSLCCGFGSLERHFVSKLPNVKSCHGVDVAEGALDVARKKATSEGLQNISYECADLNNYNWKKDKYDLVVANGALHHLSNLEEVLERIRYTLKPQGILYACEYVGPSYQDHTTRQLEIINAAAFLVPFELRARKGIPYFNERIFRLISGIYLVAAIQKIPEQWAWPQWKKNIAKILKRILHRNKNNFNFGTVFISPKHYLLRTDPSECVRSSEIVPLIKDIFSQAKIRPIGGGDTATFP